MMVLIVLYALMFVAMLGAVTTMMISLVRDEKKSKKELEAMRERNICQLTGRAGHKVQVIKWALREASRICGETKYCADCPIATDGNCPVRDENGEAIMYPADWPSGEEVRK